MSVTAGLVPKLRYTGMCVKPQILLQLLQDVKYYKAELMREEGQVCLLESHMPDLPILTDLCLLCSICIAPRMKACTSSHQNWPLQVDIVILASHLATIGYKVALRTAVGGGPGQNCFRNLCYQFLLVSGDDNPVEIVVDPKFRQILLSERDLCQSSLSRFAYSSD